MCDNITMESQHKDSDLVGCILCLYPCLLMIVKQGFISDAYGFQPHAVIKKAAYLPKSNI